MMNEQEISRIIGGINEKIYTTDLTAEKLQERISDYCDDNGKIDLIMALKWMMQESRDYTSIFAHQLVAELADEGYLVNPPKK
ncbi:hypothetical protein [Lacticaseibacillus sharpeae]|uniref:Uncharacterized protein n=1 Tax=Lacticaseibacillus sharpeae JCM 1186 = DSM 20505 TaxID=1291052 RepID=A0A0R1ZIG1_9LACO|nr:hypothetical protein [Lacticaseibacillus sharpeae]KRM54784.1 hypothetical protein FC18_GL002199 [Lacticaseibacillus sharpeae JCM 1186 = DSM 20505]